MLLLDPASNEIRFVSPNGSKDICSSAVFPIDIDEPSPSPREVDKKEGDRDFRGRAIVGSETRESSGIVCM